MKPGGTLLVTDYLQGEDDALSRGFKEYIREHEYKFLTLRQYGDMLERVGFEEVKVRGGKQHFGGKSKKNPAENNIEFTKSSSLSLFFQQLNIFFRFPFLLR